MNEATEELNEIVMTDEEESSEIEAIGDGKADPMPPEPAQRYISGTFPDRDPGLETAVKQYAKAKSLEKAQKEKATARYDIIKERMGELGLDAYHCYDSRRRIECKSRDKEVKVKEVKEDAPSPFRPGQQD